MTERFTVDYDITTGNYDIHDKKVGNGVDGYIAYLSDEEQANLICDKLNEQEKVLNKLAEENKKLKQINRNLQDFRNFITEQNISNEKQRKKLQLQMLRLYNYFENWFEDSMSSIAFGEMWENVKEDEKWEKR